MPVFVEREIHEFLGAERPHVRFAAGENRAIAQLAVDLTKEHAGDQVFADKAPRHDDPTKSRLAQMPDFIVFLGDELPYDEAGLDIKIWPIPEGDIDDPEFVADIDYRVLYMLGRMGIKPVSGAEIPEERPAGS